MTETTEQPYQWQASGTAKTGPRGTTGWYPTAKEARDAFFKQYPRKRDCNIHAGRQENWSGTPVVVMGMLDPAIYRVTKDQPLDC